MSFVKKGRGAENRLRRYRSWQLADHCVSVRWSPDGNLLAAASIAGPITLYAPRTGETVRELSGHGFGTMAISWHPAGVHLASSGQDGKAKIWNLDGTVKHELAGGSAWVERVAWSPDGTLLATAAGKKVRLWKQDGTLLREFSSHASTVADLSWRPGSLQLAAAAYNGVTLYDPNVETPLKTFDWKGSPLKLAFSPDGSILAHGNQDATIHFWYVATGMSLQMSGYPNKVRELSWDRTGRYLVAGGGPGACIWDCGGKGPEGSRPQILADDQTLEGDHLTDVAWQNRGFLLASGSLSGSVRLWQPANKKSPSVGEDRLESTASTLAWSPQDEFLAVGAGSGEVRVYRVD